MDPRANTRCERRRPLLCIAPSMRRRHNQRQSHRWSLNLDQPPVRPATRPTEFQPSAASSPDRPRPSDFCIEHSPAIRSSQITARGGLLGAW